MDKLAKVLIELAKAEAERRAQAEQADRTEDSENATPDTPAQAEGDLDA